MSYFPQDFVASAPAVARSSNVLGDDGTKNGTYTFAQILSMLQLTDFYPKLLTADGVSEDVASSITSYTLLAADKNKTKKFLASANCTVLLPAGFTKGYFVAWKAWGAGTLSFASVSGAEQVIRSTDGLRSGIQYASGGLEYEGNNEWHLTGYTKV